MSKPMHLRNSWAWWFILSRIYCKPVCVPHRQMVQSISKETFGSASVIFDLDGFCKREPFPNDMRPTHCKSQKRDEFLNAFFMHEVCFFQIKATTFKIGKKDFNPPSFFIGIQSGLALCIAGNNEEPILQSYRRQIHRLLINAAGFAQDGLLMDVQVCKKLSQGYLSLYPLMK